MSVEAAPPDFELTDTFGDGVRLSAQRGKVVALLFWARFCTSCEEDLRLFQRLAERFAADELLILGLGYASGARREIAGFAAELGVDFPMLLCSDEVRDAYEVAVFPTTILVDREGRIRLRRTGALIESYWAETIAALLAE